MNKNIIHKIILGNILQLLLQTFAMQHDGKNYIIKCYSVKKKKMGKKALKCLKPDFCFGKYFYDCINIIS